MNGVFVDMTLFLLVSSAVGCAPVFSKLAASEVAIVNNFIWNDRWTFCSSVPSSIKAKVMRLLKFHAICAGGALFSAVVLSILIVRWHINLVLGNLVAIASGTAFNYFMSCSFAWPTTNE